mmetsp:Transcript_72695/g.157112  ORF Transcript_72695/g.157112 Transcript_72695/m.157112 type:complete len:831 (-) Transcript_72695:130-2622(-)
MPASLYMRPRASEGQRGVRKSAPPLPTGSTPQTRLTGCASSGHALATGDSLASSVARAQVADDDEGGHDDVDHPEGDQDTEADPLEQRGAAELAAADLPPGGQHHDRDEGAAAEDSDADAQVPRLDLEDAVLALPVDGGHEPGQAQAEEDIHGVAAGDVADRGVGVGVLGRGGLGGEGVGERGAEGDDGDGRDLGGDAEAAAHEVREVADEGRDDADRHQRGEEAEPAVAVVRGRDAGKEDLPEDRDPMHDVVHRGGRPGLPLLLLLVAAALHAQGIDELLLPIPVADGGLVPIHRRHAHKAVHTVLHLAVRLDDDGAHGHVPLVTLDQRGTTGGLLNDDAERLLILIAAAGQDLDLDEGLSLTILERQGAAGFLIVSTCLRGVILGLVAATDLATAAIAALDMDGQGLDASVLRHLDQGFLEADLARVVVVNDADLGLRVLAELSLDLAAIVALRIGELNREVLVLLEVSVVDDGDLDDLPLAIRPKLQGALGHLKVLAALRSAVDGLVAHLHCATLHFTGADDLDLHLADALHHGVGAGCKLDCRDLHLLLVLRIVERHDLARLGGLLSLHHLGANGGLHSVGGTRDLLAVLPLHDIKQLLVAHGSVPLQNLDLSLGHFVVVHRAQLLARLPLAEPADVSPVGEDGQEREHEEGDDCLPHVDNLGGDDHDDEEEPDVREDGEEGGDGVHVRVLDVANVSTIDRDDADRGDDQEVEGGAPHNRGSAQRSELEPAEADLDHVQQNLGRRGSEGHQRQVRNRVVPDFDGPDRFAVLALDRPLLRCDLLDGGHEDIGNDGDAHKAPEEERKVQEGPRFLLPLVLVGKRERVS